MIRVACAIIFFGDQILVTQRSAAMKMPLKWEFPGGKVEKEESDLDCIKREISEEINIEFQTGNFFQHWHTIFFGRTGINR